MKNRQIAAVKIVMVFLPTFQNNDEGNKTSLVFFLIKNILIKAAVKTVYCT